MTELKELQKISRYLELILSKDGYYRKKMTEIEEQKIYGNISQK